MATTREGAQRRWQREKELARACGSGQRLLGGAAGNRTRFGALASEPKPALICAMTCTEIHRD